MPSLIGLLVALVDSLYQSNLLAIKDRLQVEVSRGESFHSQFKWKMLYTVDSSGGSIVESSRATSLYNAAVISFLAWLSVSCN
jgi:hypothetical protein